MTDISRGEPLALSTFSTVSSSSSSSSSSRLQESVETYLNWRKERGHGWPEVELVVVVPEEEGESGSDDMIETMAVVAYVVGGLKRELFCDVMELMG